MGGGFSLKVVVQRDARVAVSSFCVYRIVRAAEISFLSFFF